MTNLTAIAFHLKLISQFWLSSHPRVYDNLSAYRRPPAIQDVVFDRRAGTFTCYVYAITPEASSSLLSTVQDAIDQNVAFPLTGAAVSPDLVGITLATTISMISGSSQTDRDTAAGQAAAAAQIYLNNLRVGDPLIINDIAAAIHDRRRSRCICIKSPGVAARSLQSSPWEAWNCPCRPSGARDYLAGDAYTATGFLEPSTPQFSIFQCEELSSAVHREVGHKDDLTHPILSVRIRTVNADPWPRGSPLASEYETLGDGEVTSTLAIFSFAF
jgi:hypothetical protein